VKTIAEHHGVVKGEARLPSNTSELAITAGAVRVFESNLSGFITTGGGSIELKRVAGGLNAALDRSVHPTASDSCTEISRIAKALREFPDRKGSFDV
jgi:hypothetical protein